MVEKDQSLLWTEGHLDLAEVGDRRAIDGRYQSLLWTKGHLDLAEVGDRRAISG